MDFLARFSRLVNGMGQNLVLSWTKLVKGGQVKEADQSLQALEAKVPLLLQLLLHEDDDISTNVVGFCYDYLHVLKQVGAGLSATCWREAAADSLSGFCCSFLNSASNRSPTWR